MATAPQAWQRVSGEVPKWSGGWNMLKWQTPTQIYIVSRKEVFCFESTYCSEVFGIELAEDPVGHTELVLNCTCNLKRPLFFGCFFKRPYIFQTTNKNGLFLNDRIFVNYDEVQILHHAQCISSSWFVKSYTIVYDRIFLETTVYCSNHDRILLKRPYILRTTTVYRPYANRMQTV